MLSNEQVIKLLVQKGVITTADLAGGGKLNPKQADKFIDYVIDVTALQNVVRTVKFRNEEMQIDKIGVGNRVAVAKAEAVDPGVRRGVQTSKVLLKPVEVMVPFEISDIFQEINIEGDNVADHITKMMATQFANDLEELEIDGNVLGPARIEDELFPGGSTSQVIKDSFIGLVDGWLKLADAGNIYDADYDEINSTIFSEAIKAMPDKFKRTRRDMRFVVPTDLEQDYRNKVSTRATAQGDAALNSTANLTPFGIELVPTPLLASQPRTVEHLTLPGTTAVALKYRPETGQVVVTDQTLGATPVTPYIEDTDYVVDYVNGTIARKAGGALGDPADVKVTYLALGSQFLLTPMNNLIIAIGRDIRLERDRDIFRGVNQFALTVKVYPQIEEVSAVVKVKNVAVP